MTQIDEPRQTRNVPSELDQRLSELSAARIDCEYYLVQLIADDNGKMIFATTSYWVGWADADLRQELRKARLVNPERVITLWKELGQPYAVVHSADEMMLFMIGGGNALIEATLAEQTLSELLDATPSVAVGSRGFSHPDMLSAEAFRRAPTPKARMRVLKRDDRRCRICGRRPDNDVDLELHVHHVRPWAKGGITDESNLITLCHTCHKGLEPHADYSLFGYIECEHGIDIREKRLRELYRGISNYRRSGFIGDAG